MHVLVTGAFGYIGLALLRGLEGHRVTACGRRPRNEAALDLVPSSASVVLGDVLTEAPRLLHSGQRVDAIIHLAGGGGPKKCEADPVGAVRDNVTATATLVDAARRAGVGRLIFASTIAVYGTFRAWPNPYQEVDDARPDDFYGVLKHSAETVWTAPGLGGGTALRLGNVYGAGAGLDVGLNGAVERFARAAASGGEISIFGSGEQYIDYVHIDDTVRAFRRALEAPSLPPVLNVGGGHPVSIASLAELCERVGKETGTSPRLARQPDPGGKIWPDRSLDISLAAGAFGWKPQVTLYQGLVGLVNMMRSTSTKANA